MSKAFNPEFDIVAAWSVCRLGRSLSDLIGLLGELQARDMDLYLHQQALDTSTPSGRMLFGMLGVFSEFEGRGARETARLLNLSAAKVSEIRRMPAALSSIRFCSTVPVGNALGPRATAPNRTSFARIRTTLAVAL